LTRWAISAPLLSQATTAPGVSNAPMRSSSLMSLGNVVNELGNEARRPRGRRLASIAEPPRHRHAARRSPHDGARDGLARETGGPQEGDDESIGAVADDVWPTSPCVPNVTPSRPTARGRGVDALEHGRSIGANSVTGGREGMETFRFTHGTATMAPRPRRRRCRAARILRTGIREPDAARAPPQHARCVDTLAYAGNPRRPDCLPGAIHATMAPPAPSVVRLNDG